LVEIYMPPGSSFNATKAIPFGETPTSVQPAEGRLFEVHERPEFVEV
jgi:hypothetical protein